VIEKGRFFEGVRVHDAIVDLRDGKRAETAAKRGKVKTKVSPKGRAAKKGGGRRLFSGGS